jgi:hypothetical protein
MQSREALECKQRLIDTSGGSPEDQNANKNIDSEGQAHKL